MLPDVQFDLVSTVAGVVSIFSVLGSGFIIITYVKFPDIRNFISFLVFNMALADCIGSISLIFAIVPHFEEYIPLCIFQSIGVSLGYTASILWSMLIAFTQHMAYIREEKEFTPANVHNFAKLYLFIGWGISSIFTILPILTQSYGRSGGICWIISDPMGRVWQFLQLYVWIWGAIFYCSYVYICVINKLRETSREGIKIRRIMYYPLVLILTWIFPTIHRMYNIISGGKYILFLNIINFVTSGLFGFFNAIVYGANPILWEKIQMTYLSHLRSQQSSEDESASSNYHEIIALEG